MPNVERNIPCETQAYARAVLEGDYGDGQLEIMVQTFDHGMDIFSVPGSGCDCLLWTTARGGPLRTNHSNGND